MSGNEVSIQAVWVDGLKFEAVGAASRTSFVMDASEDAGGSSEGVRPTEALLAAMAGCSGMDIILMLRKMKQDVTGLTINVTGVRAEDYPRPVESVTVEYILRGHQISENSVARAVKLSETKYCGVMASLKAQITTSYVIEEG